MVHFRIMIGMLRMHEIEEFLILNI